MLGVQGCASQASTVRARALVCTSARSLAFSRNLNLNINFNFNQLPPQPACLELIALCFYASLFGSKMKKWISVPHNPITPSFACSTQITKMVPKCRLRRPILALMPVPAQRRTRMVSYMLKRRRPKTKKRSGWMGIQCLRPRSVRSIVRRCPRLRPGPVDVRIGRARGCHGRHALQWHALRRHSLW